MEIGYFSIGAGPTTDPRWLRTAATAAERLSFASIWAPEHVVLVDQYTSKYPYSSGHFPGPANAAIGDPFATLAYVAACTSKIRLGTGICIVPEHNPVVLAKTIATVDRLSGGRFILGVGIGWLAEELGAGHSLRAPRATHPRLYRCDAQAVDPGVQFASRRIRQFHQRVQPPQARQRQGRAGMVRWRERPGTETRGRIRRRMARFQTFA